MSTEATFCQRERRVHVLVSLTNDTSLGVMRYADAGYGASLDEIEKKHIPHIDLA